MKFVAVKTSSPTVIGLKKTIPLELEELEDAVYSANLNARVHEDKLLNVEETVDFVVKGYYEDCILKSGFISDAKKYWKDTLEMYLKEARREADEVQFLSRSQKGRVIAILRSYYRIALLKEDIETEEVKMSHILKLE